MRVRVMEAELAAPAMHLRASFVNCIILAADRRGDKDNVSVMIRLRHGDLCRYRDILHYEPSDLSFRKGSNGSRRHSRPQPHHCTAWAFAPEILVGEKRCVIIAHLKQKDIPIPQRTKRLSGDVRVG
jgi:hypothetical protein